MRAQDDILQALRHVLEAVGEMIDILDVFADEDEAEEKTVSMDELVEQVSQKTGYCERGVREVISTAVTTLKEWKE